MLYSLYVMPNLSLSLYIEIMFLFLNFPSSTVHIVSHLSIGSDFASIKNLENLFGFALDLPVPLNFSLYNLHPKMAINMSININTNSHT